MRSTLALVLCALCSCSASMMPGADAGLSGGDAGVMDAGVTRDAGVFDAGPSEPTLSSAVLFRDDFERYVDLQGLRAAYPEIRELGGAIALERDGGQSLRLDYSAAGACAGADVHVGKIISGDVPTVMVTWRERVPSNFTPCGDAGVEGFVLQRGVSRTSFEALEGKWALRTGSTDFVQHLRLDTHAPGVLAREAWHRVTMILTRQSAPSVSDGVVRVWVDGALVIDLVGAVGTAPFTLATWPGAVTLDAASARWVDDLAISTP